VEFFSQMTNSLGFVGPIVRIGPNELHIRDSEYYHQIYSGSGRIINKDPATVGAFSVPTSVAATIDHFHHRARRGYLNPYFSRRAIIEIEPLIQERLDRLCMRFEEALHHDTILNLDAAFAALTADIITMRFYGEHFDYLGVPDFKSTIRETFAGASLIYHTSRFVPGLVAALKCLPLSIVRMVLPAMADLHKIREGIKKNVINSLGDSSKAVIASTLLDPNIPTAERGIDRLMDEGTTLIFAGTETTARALSVAMFYLLSNPEVMHKLRSEISSVPIQSGDQNGQHSLYQLESLPYLVSI